MKVCSTRTTQVEHLSLNIGNITNKTSMASFTWHVVSKLACSTLLRLPIAPAPELKILIFARRSNYNSRPRIRNLIIQQDRLNVEGKESGALSWRWCNNPGLEFRGIVSYPVDVTSYRKIPDFLPFTRLRRYLRSSLQLQHTIYLGMSTSDWQWNFYSKA